MKILFDFRVFEPSSHRGIGRYIYCLVDHILKNYPEIEISILKTNNELPVFNYNNDKVNYYYYDQLDTYKNIDNFDFWFFDDMLVSSIKLKSINNFFDDIFPKKLLQSCKRIVAIGYDLVPLIFPKKYLFNNNLIYKYFLHLETLYVTDYLFAISESTKNDFIKYLNIEESKILNIYGSIDNKFNNLNISQYDFNKRINNFIFISAYDDPRKNVFRLIKAFSIAFFSNKIPKDSKLYLCGKVDNYYNNLVKDEIKKNNLTKNQVIIMGYVSDEKLIDLISSCKFTIFQSLYEGLGLPILESYACNTPAFVSNVSSTKELVLEECSFNPYDEDDIANAIINGFNNKELCEKSLVFGKKLIEEKCNWDIASKKVINKLYEINNLPKIDIDLVVFANLDLNINKYKEFNNIKTKHIFSYDCDIDNSIYLDYYKIFLNKYNYKKKLFILSNDINSSTKYLEYAIEEKDKNNSYIILNNPNIVELIFAYYNYSINKIVDIINKYYNIKLDNIEGINDIKNILYKNNINEAEIIASITSINNIIIS